MATAERCAAIVGIGETAYTKRGELGAHRTELSLACEAILKAVADAGLEIDQIDGLASYSDDRSEPWALQEALGLPDLHFASLVWGGGGSGACGAIAHAVAAVASGMARHVVVLRALCQTPEHRYGQYGGFGGFPNENFSAPFGLFSPPLMLAPLVQRYKYEFGITDEQFGEVALACRDNASRNPRAVMKDRPLTMRDYLNCRMIAEPLRLYDCCQENDGACALVVTSLERARDLAQKPVEVLAAAQGVNPGWGGGGFGSHNMAVDDYGAGNAAALASELYGRAGLGPGDVDTAQIYDHFSGFVLMALENFGFCGRGEGGAFAADGNIRWPDGRLPLNTSGGHLSEAYIHGLNLAVEGVRQIRGQSTSQVTGAETCLVAAGLGGVLTSAALLGG